MTHTGLTTQVDPGFESLPYVFSALADSGDGEAEHQLVCAIIYQALWDYCQESQTAIWEGIRREARQWLLYDRNDFLLICDLAGIIPQVLRGVIIKAEQSDEAMAALRKNASKYLHAVKIGDKVSSKLSRVGTGDAKEG